MQREVWPASRRCDEGLFAQLAEVVIGEFINDEAQNYIRHYADRLGQMRTEKIADHIRQSNGQCQGGKSAHADNPAVNVQVKFQTPLKT